MTDFKCPKCGQQLHSRTDLEIHEKHCEGATISMATIQNIASGNSVEVCFDCVICGGSQPILGIHNWGREVIFPVCDNCKSDLKDIILTKRKNNGTT